MTLICCFLYQLFIMGVDFFNSYHCIFFKHLFHMFLYYCILRINYYYGIIIEGVF